MKRIAGELLLLAGLAGGWLLEGPGTRMVAEEGGPQTPQSVKLQWHASTTPNVRYNVYRGTSPGVHNQKLNAAPLNQLTFADTTVVSGASYCYVVRAENSAHKESSDSNETCVKIP